MRQPGLVEGCYVKINKNISETNRRFQTTGEMHDMKGKVFKAGYISGSSIYIEGFTWYIGDVEVMCTEKDSQPFHFDIEVLDEKRT